MIPSRIQVRIRSYRILDPRGSCGCTAEDLSYARLSAEIRAARYKSPLRACASRESCFLLSRSSVPPDYVNSLERPSSSRIPCISIPLLPRRRVCALAIHRAISHALANCPPTSRQASPDTSTIATHLNQTRLRGLLDDR